MSFNGYVVDMLSSAFHISSMSKNVDFYLLGLISVELKLN